MIFRLLCAFVAGVMLDGIVILLRYQVPGVIEPLIRFWKELAIVALFIVYMMFAIRGGGVRLAAPRALIATWMLLIALGFLEIFVTFARGSAAPEEALRALRTFYLYPLLFGIVVLPPRPLPVLIETRLFHLLGMVSLFIVAAGMSQMLWSQAWIDAPWVSRAAREGAIDVRNLQGLFRPFGTFVSSFSFGHFCAEITVLVSAYLLFHRRSHWFYRLVLPVAAAGLLISTVRASIIGAFVGAAYLVVIKLRVMGGMGMRAVLAAGLVVACMAGPFAMAAYQEHGRARSVKEAYLARGSLEERVEDEWKPAWKRLKTPADFVFGLGTGAIGGSLVKQSDKAGPFQHNSVDNYYLLILVNHGILGLLVWGAFTAQLWWLILRASMMKAEVIWFLHGSVALLVMGLGVSFFRMLLAAPAESVCFWVFMGLAAARAHELIQGRAEPRKPAGLSELPG